MANVERSSSIERIKTASQSLRGTISAELNLPQPEFSPDNALLLKFHGVIQHDNRDARRQRSQNGIGKQYQFTVRVRPTGGRLTARQLLGLLDLAAAFRLDPPRITSRQGIQLGPLRKESLRKVIREIAELGLTTFSSSGDVNCNVMCCAAVVDDRAAQRHLQSLAEAIAAALMPDPQAYEGVWLSDGASAADGICEPAPVDAFYGAAYLPHKLKIGVAVPEDNCVDVYAQDIGLLMIRSGNNTAGYEVLVGGGMGMVPSAANHHPMLAQPLAFVSPDDLLQVVRAIVAVYRDFGNRACRGEARLKYLIKNWGLEKFKHHVERECGRTLPAPRGIVVTGREDHLGWRVQGDGRWMLGLPIESGRLGDGERGRIATALRETLARHGTDVRLTAQQNVLLCDLDAACRTEIDSLLSRHDVVTAGALSDIRRTATACPALPSCGYAITEAERIVPQLLADLERELEKLSLAGERCTICVTGCPNGCARCYLADIALVGRTVDTKQSADKFAIYIGGDHLGCRLNQLYKDLVPIDDVIASLRPLLVCFRRESAQGERLGTFLHRWGVESLRRFGESLDIE